MVPHRIRLRGPWECEPLARAVSSPDGQVEWRTESLPEAGRIALPCPWAESALADFAGRVRFRRRFGYPGRIDADERVWLTFADVSGQAVIRLNGQLLGRHDGGDPFEFEVTALLATRNELVIEIETQTVPAGLWGQVALEIRGPAG
jgi:beta-galactosidase/beta-glucuronidase